MAAAVPALTDSTTEDVEEVVGGSSVADAADAAGAGSTESASADTASAETTSAASDSPDTSESDTNASLDANAPDTNAPDTSTSDAGESGASEADSADSSDDAAPVGPTASRGRKIWAAVVAALVVVAIGAGVWAGLVFRENRQVDAAQKRDALIVATARGMVANLVTLRYGSAEDDVRRIQAGTTGDFRNQFADTTGSFATVLKQGKVESTGEATSIALLSADDNQAQAIAAVTSTVKNSEAPEGQQRVYRMKVHLTKQGDNWLVSNMEFVS